MSRMRRIRPLLGSAVASSPWILVSIGVLVMVVLLAVALGTARDRRTYAELPPPDAPMSLPGVPATTASPGPTATGASARPTRPTALPTTSKPGRPSSSATGGGTRRPAPSRSSASSAPPATSGPPALAASAVTGRYAVAARFDTGFIGEVLVTNTGSARSGWTVRLSFPDGWVRETWVVGAEQGRASVYGSDLTYQSGADLAAGASVPLRFRIEPAVTTKPDRCTVNGSPCTGF
jgi:hypothetical protein